MLLKKYVAWEKGVIELYAACAKEALSQENCEAYLCIKELLFDVRKELSYVEDLQIELESVDYEVLYIKKIQERFIIEWA